MGKGTRMKSIDRVRYYLKQTGRKKMTPKQERRNRHKNRKLLG